MPLNPAEILASLFVSALVALWVAVAWKAHAALREMRWLEPASNPGRSGARCRRLSVIIPARDEQQLVSAALGSVLAQDGVEMEVVAVNDHSSDSTGRLLDALAEIAPALTVYHSPEPRAGWLGKTNAIRHALAHAGKADYTLFADADIVHLPGCFAAAIETMEAENLDLLTIIPSAEWRGVWENALAPMVPVLLLAACRPEYEDPDSPRAFGLGAFLLARTSKYEELGGHEPIRAAVPNDIGLAKHMKAGGARIGVRVAPKCVRLRMFVGARGISGHLSRNFAKMLAGKPIMALPVGATIALLYLGAPSLAVAGLLVRSPALTAAGLLGYAAPYAATASFIGLSRVQPLELLLYPLGAFPLIGALAEGLRSALRGEVVWRGRAIPNAASEGSAGPKSE